MGSKGRDSSGFYEIGKEKFVSSTTVLDKLEKYAIHPWIAKTTAEYIRDGILEHLIAGDMSLDQLREMDLNLFMKQAKKEYEEKKREAMDVGSVVHKAIEEYYAANRDIKILENSMIVDGRIVKALKAFRDWEKRYQVEPIGVEMTVYSNTHEYAGTLDLWAKITCPEENFYRYVIIDHKASSQIYESYIMQIASYYFALNEMRENEEGLDGAGILRLDKETGIPEFSLYSEEELEKPFYAFLAVLNYFKWEMAWKSETRAKRATLKAAPPINKVGEKSIR
jgi:hypothetical protein